MEVKERILSAASDLFMRYGCKSVTMDDIARHLAVSKKTIYQYYQDKDEIVHTFAQKQFACEVDYMKAITEAAANPIEEIVGISRHIRDAFSRINPALLFDLRKYHLRSWQLYDEYKRSIVSEQIGRNLEWGIREGFYRPDINVAILTKIRVELIQLAFDPEVFPPLQFDFVNLHLHIMEHFVRGIVTEKGLALFNQYKTEFDTIPQL